MTAGDSAIMDMGLIREFSPAMADVLQPWPLLYDDTFNPHTPAISTLICNYLDRQVGVS